MSRPPEELVCRYLDGSASAQEVRLLDQALQSDPQLARLLVDMSALDTHLAQAIQLDRGAAEVSADESREAKAAPAPKPAKPRRSAWRIWTVAAAMAASVSVATAGWLHVTQPEAMPPLIAQVIHMKGAAYRVTESGHVFPVLEGDWIPSGNVIVTAGFPITRVVAMCRDGTLVQLENSTRASISDRPRGKRADLFDGEMIVLVTPQGSGREMVFLTGDARTEASDACLYLRSQSDETVVSVEYGTVDSHRRSDRQPVMVAAGRHTVICGELEFATRGGLDPWHVSLIKAFPLRWLRISPGIRYAKGMVFTGTHFWISNGNRVFFGEATRGRPEKLQLFKVRAEDGRIVQTLDLGAFGDHCHDQGSTSLAWDGKFLWVADLGKWILKVDPNAAPGVDPVREKIDEGGRKIQQVAIVGDSLWGYGQVNRFRDWAFYRFCLSTRKWIDADDISFPELRGRPSITGVEGALCLHVVPDREQNVEQERPVVIYKLTPLDGKAFRRTPAFSGSEVGSRVEAIYYDPIRKEFWILSRDWGWIRPMSVKPIPPPKKADAAAPPPEADAAAPPAKADVESQSQILLARGPAVDSASALAENRDERIIPLLQAVLPGSLGAGGVTNDRESLTTFGPQLESKIAPHKKVLHSLNLQQGRFSAPPAGASEWVSFGVPNCLEILTDLLVFVRRKGSIHA